MADGLTDVPGDLVAAASGELERAVRRLPADAWDRPTPSDLSVRELVAHVVVGNRLTAMLLEGVSRADARARVQGDQLGDRPLEAVVESSRRQARAFASSSLDDLVEGPRGVDVEVAAYVRFRVVDLVVHAWDLRRGAGLDETLDEATVVGVLELVEPHLDEMLAYGSYGAGPSGELPPGASPQRTLLDWFGRRP